MSAPAEASTEASVVPKNADAKYFERTGSIDLDPRRPRLEDEQRGDLLQEHRRGLLAEVVVADHREDHRELRATESLQ